MSTLLERHTMCGSRLLQERVSQALSEAGKDVKLTVASVSAIVLATQETVAARITDEEILTYVASLA